MPTRHERIAVVKDEALSEALASVAPIVGGTKPASALVHDLAIRGAAAMRAEAAEREEQLQRLADWATGREEPPWDPEVLARIDELQGL